MRVIILFPEGMFWPRRVLERYARCRRVCEKFSHVLTHVLGIPEGLAFH